MPQISFRNTTNRGRWLGKLRQLFASHKRSAEARIDISSGNSLGVDGNLRKYRLAEKVIHELRVNELGLPIGFEDHIRLLIGLLGHAVRGAPYEADELVPEGVAKDEVKDKIAAFWARSD